METLTSADKEALVRFAGALVDQHAAQKVISPRQPAAGFWFGGGNVIQLADGSLVLVGRYRDAGDSREGVAQGKRGWQLSIFQADGVDHPFREVVALGKDQLSSDSRQVLSIEGAAIRVHSEYGFELFVSSEKSGIGYPVEVKEYLKPGTGVWSIDRIAAGSLTGLARASIHPCLESVDPQTIHVKDPFLYRRRDGRSMLLFCSHPFCWTSSNTGYVPLEHGQPVQESIVFDWFQRGFTWDVAITRATCIVDVPRVGRFQERHVTLVFYDGGECVRDLEQHATSQQRPRGFSCEEIGGLAYFVNNDFSHIHRLSKYQPLFVSPFGTGCSRYVDITATDTGMLAMWQQSRSDSSQPLVKNFLTHQETEEWLR